MKKHLFGKLSLIQSYKLRYTVNGFAWLVYAISHLFDNIVCKIICVLALSIAVICTYAFFRNGEEEDEMALSHIYRAKAYTIDLLHVAVLVIGMISLWGVDFLVHLNDVYGFIVAAVNILIGCIFVHLEKVGD